MQLLKKFMILSIAFSAMSCGSTLKITMCFSEPPHGLRCLNPKTKKFYWVKYEYTQNYVAMPQADAKLLFEYLKTKCSK